MERKGRGTYSTYLQCFDLAKAAVVRALLFVILLAHFHVLDLPLSAT